MNTHSVFLVGSACDSLELAFIFDNDSPRALHLVFSVSDSSQLQLAGLRDLHLFLTYMLLYKHILLD